MKYTKKPVEIEARKLEFTTDSQESIITWIRENDYEASKGGDGGIYIPTLEGVMYASTGDYIIKGVKGEFYPCKPDIFEMTYGVSLPVEEYEEPNYSSVEQLTILQRELGYSAGYISSVALLGLVGEAGEVMCETSISIFNDRGGDVVSNAIRACADAELLKKEIRKGEFDMKFDLTPGREEAFDNELADTFGYINALAINRGLTIFDLAQKLHDKIRAKQAAGGSSEDTKNK